MTSITRASTAPQDSAFSWILQTILNANTGSDDLWLVDENATEQWRELPANLPLSIMGNRFDLIEAMQTRFEQARFSDFDFTNITSASLSRIFYRISKEKAVVHHIANEALRCLKPGGQLILCGYKNEGIKTFCDTIAERFGCPKNAIKQRDIYSVALTKQCEPEETTPLPDKDYTQLREITLIQNVPLLSKPGQFGWDKQDAGSQLLIECLENHLSTKPEVDRPHNKCLDLGCGYGYLSIMASQLAVTSNIQEWVLTDNNAAAIISARANSAQFDLKARVEPTDCAAGIHETFNLVLCNPPFHQGFDVDNSLTDKFLRNTRSHLARGASAYFVVNQFIPLERKAAQYFKDVELLRSNGKFKVIRLA